jgi:hypothetical protein
MLTRSDALNDALERLDGYGYFDALGFAQHGPMGAETLSTLGHDDLVAEWVETYKTKHAPIPPPPRGDRIDPARQNGWRPALGDYTRVTDWEALFAAELSDAAWPNVVRAWLPRLLPGYSGALTHGLIRVGHAVRALPADREPSSTLLTELARALALLAATFTPLSGRPSLDAVLLLRLIDIPPSRARAIGGGPTVPTSDDGSGFGPAVDALATAEDPEAALGELSTAFCRILTYPDVAALPLVHTVTPITAIRTLRPLVPDLTVETAYAHLWRVGAALVAAFTSPTTGVESNLAEHVTEPPSPEELLARALEHREPHALKLADACVREYRLRAEPLYLRAAARVIDHIPAW